MSSNISENQQPTNGNNPQDLIDFYGIKSPQNTKEFLKILPIFQKKITNLNNDFKELKKLFNTYFYDEFNKIDYKEYDRICEETILVITNIISYCLQSAFIKELEQN